MAQTVPTLDAKPSPAVNEVLTPPDESLWVRYSAHGELPLSGASSLAIHLLIFGLMLLSAWLAYAVFGRGSRSLPVEAVRLEVGGGGGSPHGRGDGPGVGKGPDEAGEEGPSKADPADPIARPELKVEAGTSQPIKFNDDAVRYIHRSDTPASRAIMKLADANNRFRVPDRKSAGHGKGGTGKGGGSGEGVGTGTGNGRGEGTGKLTQREKRMLRWTMMFNTNSALNYLSQLKGLGAILAIPIREDAAGREYRVVRKLTAPAKLIEEDIEKIQRIFWIDDNPQSVQDMMAVLRLPLRPSHFVAFMPEELEAKLYKLEKDYLDKHYSGRGEDDIAETKFRINQSGKGYEPEVLAMKVK
jgi:hypothetical protein